MSSDLHQLSMTLVKTISFCAFIFEFVQPSHPPSGSNEGVLKICGN